MFSKSINKALICSIVAVGSTFASPILAKEKLKIFILAGQSNMVGHADAHTIATLFNSGNDRDNSLTKLVFKNE